MHDQEVPPVLQVAGAVLLMTFQGLSRLKFQGLVGGESIRSSWIYGLLTLVQRPFITNELNFIENRLELMAKSIQSHPTSHMLVPELIFGTILILSKFGHKMDLRVLHFPTSLQGKKRPPKENKCAWTIPSY